MNSGHLVCVPLVGFGSPLGEMAKEYQYAEIFFASAFSAGSGSAYPNTKPISDAWLAKVPPAVRPGHAAIGVSNAAH